MEAKRMREAASVEARLLENLFLQFYALPATHFPLRKRPICRVGARRFAPLSVTALTALTIHLLKATNLSIVFERISQRDFLPSCFFC